MNDLWLEETYGGYEADVARVVPDGSSQPVLKTDK